MGKKIDESVDSGNRVGSFSFDEIGLDFSTAPFADNEVLAFLLDGAKPRACLADKAVLFAGRIP